jgi:site-specific DNA-methyltransferase (adenine-specific)
LKFQDLKNGRFYWEDCFDAMKEIPDGVIDMILCDLPYGTTACNWDAILPFDKMWSEYIRITKHTATFVLTASLPFSAALVSSNFNLFKYSWIWQKSRATGHVHAKNKPMKEHEDVLIFSKGTTVHANQSEIRMTYNPQNLIKLDIVKIRKKGGAANTVMGERPSHKDTEQTETGYPTSILKIASEGSTFHPTQKPVALFEYLIKTYTNENDLILDNCAGSGTTAIAAINTNRRWICIEKEEEYANKAIERIANHKLPVKIELES